MNSMSIVEMLTEMQMLGMKLVEIPKDIKLSELQKEGSIYLWMNKKKNGEGIIINGRKLTKVGENENNYLYQEMR